MINQVQVLERLTLVAPFGVRFWDTVSGRAIGEGLTVTAYPHGNPARRVHAFANRSGVYALCTLPSAVELAP